jgi:hypothetical protein
MKVMVSRHVVAAREIECVLQKLEKYNLHLQTLRPEIRLYSFGFVPIKPGKVFIKRPAV